jgi:hypothetical protein
MATTRIFIQNPGWMCNHIWGWARAMAALESRSDREDVELYMDWPQLHGHILFPKTFTSPPPGDASGFWRIKRKEIATCTGDCSIAHSSHIPVPDESRVEHYMRQITFSDAIKASISDINFAEPILGVHIRYGLYVKPPAPRNCPHGIRAPNSYYTDLVDFALSCNLGLGVFLASDGRSEELKWFTDRYNPARVRIDCCPFLPAGDLLALSRCRAIIGSQSTFSHAAAVIGGVNMTWPSYADRNMLRNL